jgi:arylsulfatase A-like enzyme
MKQITMLTALIGCGSLVIAGPAPKRPNIILVMADDQGWGQTSYNHHPVLKTPNLDLMAENGIRFNRFYAAAPYCSPTRASVITGRSNDRTGVNSVGYPLCKQEKTIAQALKGAGYKTAHFGKWHLNGISGPGAPIFKNDERSPGKFGFDTWLSVSNFFDLNPIMSRNGEFVEMKGESSHIIVNEALDYIKKEKESDKPLFVVIWYGSPHAPWRAEMGDKEPFVSLDEETQNYYGELTGMDNSIGDLRKGLRDMKIAENTLIWFNSDNGGISYFGQETVGGLRGSKGQIFEGGLRVPCVIEWPAGINKSRITDYPASTMDIFPTIADVVGLPKSCMTLPVDGISIKDLFTCALKKRSTPIPFRHQGRGAFVDNNYKLISMNISKDAYMLYDLAKDPNETTDVLAENKGIADKMIQEFKAWNQSVDASVEGKDYPDGLTDPRRRGIMWNTLPEFAPYLKEWKKRPEYAAYLDEKAGKPVRRVSAVKKK